MLPIAIATPGYLFSLSLPLHDHSSAWRYCLGFYGLPCSEQPITCVASPTPLAPLMAGTAWPATYPTCLCLIPAFIPEFQHAFLFPSSLACLTSNTYAKSHASKHACPSPSLLPCLPFRLLLCLPPWLSPCMPVYLPVRPPPRVPFPRGLFRSSCMTDSRPGRRRAPLGQIPLTFDTFPLPVSASQDAPYCGAEL